MSFGDRELIKLDVNRPLPQAVLTGFMERDQPSILIIDDDEQIRSLLKELLVGRFDCVDVGSAEEALSVDRFLASPRSEPNIAADGRQQIAKGHYSLSQLERKLGRWIKTSTL